jgi:hypothetical protein
MNEYRLYQLDTSGHIAGPPDGFNCEEDGEAIERARRMMDANDVELWQMDRLVIRLKPREP